MNAKRISAYLWSAVFTMLMACGAHARATPLHQQPDATTAAAPSAQAKVADLAFFSGRWTGSAGGDKTEQYCSTTDPAVMVCIFRSMDAKGTDSLELYTLRDTPSGVEERIRFFEADLKESANDPGVTMKLVDYSPTRMVFENPTGTFPKRSTLTRVGNDDLTSRIELVDGQGKTTIIEAHWTRAK
jgi:hypothetical protein